MFNKRFNFVGSYVKLLRNVVYWRFNLFILLIYQLNLYTKNEKKDTVHFVINLCIK